jgi:membrane protein involved in colicin uptake
MGWYGEPESEAKRESDRQRLAEARQLKAEAEAKEGADRESGAAYRRVTVPFVRGSTGL